MITMDSRIGEVYATTVGHDAFYKVLLQLGLSEKLILNPIVSRLKLKTVSHQYMLYTYRPHTHKDLRKSYQYLP